MKKLLVYIVVIFGFSIVLNAQRQPKPTVKSPLDSDAFIEMMDNTLIDYYTQFSKDPNYDSIINSLEFEENEIGEVSDSVYCERLEKLNNLTPFHLDCNEITLGMIRFFVKNRRGFTKIVLGRSKLYFDLYEATLAKHDMPIELKYLSVIESGLRPQVKSPAGALGLWQFMYGTGKNYGLIENSYVDERMDPVKSTEAACKFLKKLFGIYNDWNLALAAYNAGPGNVNKAIRRSGGKRTYWEVRPFLPRETQGYVPNFIAATYLMTYHAQHNIVPATNKHHFYQLDTICLSKGIHMSTIEKLTGWSESEVASLNPIYKTKFIPQTDSKQCITGPIKEIGKLVSVIDSLYNLEKSIYSPKPKPVIIPVDSLKNTNDTIIIPSIVSKDTLVKPISKSVKKSAIVWHKVKRGETLSTIASAYGVETDQVKKWNYLRSNVAPKGRWLKILKSEEDKVSETVVEKEIVNAVKESVQSKNTKEVIQDSLNSLKNKITPKVKTLKVEKKQVLDTNELLANKINSKNSKVKPNDKLKNSTKELIVDTSVTIFHTVLRGELLSKISEKYNVAVNDVIKWNNLTSSSVIAGQKLKIISKVQLPIIDVKTLVKPTPVKPKVIVPTKKYYTIKPGDMFNRLAESHGITPQQLHDLNPGIDPNTIRVGQLLRVK
jgi:membrane-bound lytic murein transglycosylase D